MTQHDPSAPPQRAPHTTHRDDGPGGAGPGPDAPAADARSAGAPLPDAHLLVGATSATGGPRDVVPFREAVRVWFAISLQTFGGPAGQIAVMQRHLVEERRWIGQRRFLHA